MKEVARAIILDKDQKVFLGKRARGNGAGQWALIGGKPEQGETIEEAITREVLEETGFNFIPTYFKEMVDGRSDNEPWKVYFFSGPATGNLTLKPDEIVEGQFFTEEELVSLDIAFNHTEIITEYFSSKNEVN